MAAEALKTSKQYFPKAGGASDGWSTDTEATATCFCGAVQMSFPLQAPGLMTTFICNCTDCRKITASTFASNFVILNTHAKHLRGQENLTKFSQSKTPANGNVMSDYFCKTCGTLMYRIPTGPGPASDHYIMRFGTVDDFNLQETKLRPRLEAYTKNRVTWLPGCKGVATQFETFWEMPKETDSSS